ncbi:MAG: DUF1997 domain-containing protein [Synechococcus sp. BS307-5m-G36]|nr:DUF1997 domain-containing protein [Synechococcus sp. BS307-5m-G36]MBL6880477.1 DUF1997 domain-containing protein [Synechococcus sp. BS30m-G31]
MLLLSRTDTANLRHDNDPQVRCYRSQFSDQMEMLSASSQVEDYLDRHQGWFKRCAAPMRVHPVDAQSYDLTLGKFGNFGFEVEPTIALRLLPQHKGIYRIETIPSTPKAQDLSEHYDVDFQASMQLIPMQENSDQPNETLGTSVQWDLDLSVWIRLPKVITILPDQLVQSSGDHLLKQIVRQISRRLTWKVQEDFHSSHDLICPPQRRAAF